MNAVAFYVLKGQLLVAFYEVQGGGTACVAFKNVEPSRIAATLDEKLGFPFKAMCLVMRMGLPRRSPFVSDFRWLVRRLRFFFTWALSAEPVAAG